MEKHADKWLDKPNVVGVGIGENKAGKAVIHVYRLKDDDEGIPSEVDGVAVEQVRSGRFDPRALPTDRWPRPVPIGVSSGLADFATGTLGARVTNGTNVYALSNNHVFAGVNTASIGDAITQPGVEDGGSDPADRIATLADYQAIDFNGGNNIMDAAIAVTSAGNVATATPPDGYGTPSTTPTSRCDRNGSAEVRAHDGLSAGRCARRQLFRRRLLLRIGRVLLPGLRSAFRQPDLRLEPVVQRAGRFRLSYRHAGWESAGRASLCRRRPADDREPDHPGAAALRRHDRRRSAWRRATGRPHRPARALAGDASVELSWNGSEPSTAARPSRATRSTAARARRRELPSPRAARRRATPTRAPRTARPTTTRCPRVNANGEGPLSNEASATPSALVAPSSRCRSSTPSTAPTRTRSPTPGAGRTASSAGETGLYVTSNQLACSKTTTCTAWRNATQYGPDVEVWARVATLPGATTASASTRVCSGHSHLRRLHAAHATSSSGNRPGLARALRRRRYRQPPDRSSRSSRPATSAPARQGLDASRPGATTARPGRASASSRTRPTAPRLRRRGPARHDRPARRLRRAHDRRQPARRPHRPARALAGDASVTLAWTARASTAARRHGLQGLSRHELRPARAPPTPAISRRATPTRPLPTARPTTTRCPRSTRTARARSPTRPRPHPVGLVAPIDAARRSSTPSTAQREPALRRRRWTNGVIGWRDRPHTSPRTSSPAR